MELLVAYQDDAAGYNMAKYLSKGMVAVGDDNVFHGRYYDLAVIPTPAISADWLEDKYEYDGFIFLSKHAAESGTLALTCHSTGNFSSAKFGGNDRQVAIPKPDFQKVYLQALNRDHLRFPDFQITIEATHHGPTALSKPSIFVEIGTTERQWTDQTLCGAVAALVHEVMSKPVKEHPVAICFGGTHYPSKFTDELLYGQHSLGTVIPKHALDFLDKELFLHVLAQNPRAKTALLDWRGMGSDNKQKILSFLELTDLEIVKL